MSKEESDSQRLFFEVLERTIRFISHVESSCAQAARPNRRKTAQETIASTLTVRLRAILNSLIDIYKTKTISENELLSQLYIALDSLADLHTGPLTAVPRPHEPIELVSYIRQAYKSDPAHIASAVSPPHVFATEILGDQAHSRFDQNANSNFELAAALTSATKTPNQFFELANSLLIEPETSSLDRSLAGSESATQDKSIGFISLPRMDLGNPLRWPSLIHETGHFETKSKKDKVWDAFSNMQEGILKDSALECMKQYLNNSSLSSSDELQKWLVECWCDIHAVRVTGVPVLFSQMHAFLFSSPCYLTESVTGSGYPPAWFRLRLMRSLITTRHKENNSSNSLIKDIISKEWEILERLFPPAKNADVRHGHLKSIFNYFLLFLTEQFPQNTWLEQSQISPDNLQELIEDLTDGLPIPTHRKFVGKKQHPASHAEILLAGWSYRNKNYKKSLIDILEKPDFELNKDFPHLLAIVDRAEASLRMSLQVSEWFDILSKPSNIKTSGGNNYSQNLTLTPGAGLLSDHEIVNLLLNNSIRIVPLIGSIDDIAGTVLDLRLGHNFEIFFTNISGSVDALNNKQRHTIDSMEVDYDSLEGLEIAPGQFILGHTLEYIKLPPDIAADINGRSSFARLGIEVHMTAPFVEAGFEGCLTLEIANSGHSSIKLYPGMRIAQLRFYRCSSKPLVPYSGRSEVKYRGRLRHNKTAQFNDWEIEAFNTETSRRNGNA